MIQAGQPQRPLDPAPLPDHEPHLAAFRLQLLI